jgi:hypothetical protein
MVKHRDHPTQPLPICCFRHGAFPREDGMHRGNLANIPQGHEGEIREYKLLLRLQDSSSSRLECSLLNVQVLSDT